MNYEKTQEFVNHSFEKEVLPNLCEFVKIDNLSCNFDVEWNTNGKLEKAANFCLDWALNQGIKGIKGEIIKDHDKTPFILIEIEANGSDTNFLLYGHFDKQPHFEGWMEGLGPITPVIKNGNLYGRGAADDGYALFASITGIKAVQEQAGKHGRIVIAVEGCEESGSPHLVHYLEKLKDRIGKPDLLVCLDSGAQDYNTLWITNSLRGLLTVDVTIEVLEEAVHSGSGTGLAPDSFMILRNILDRIEDSSTGKVIDCFHVDIPKKRIEEAKLLGELKKEEVLKMVKFKKDVTPISKDYGELILNNTWRPTLCITGAEGIPDYKTAGNVLRSSLTMRLSVRLPPTLDASVAAKKLCETISTNTPFNSFIKANVICASSGWNNKNLSDRLCKSLNLTSQKVWGKEMMGFGEGVGIPFITLLSQSFPNCEILVIGLLGPDSNAHGANESMNINYCKGLTVTLAHTLNDYSIL